MAVLGRGVQGSVGMAGTFLGPEVVPVLLPRDLQAAPPAASGGLLDPAGDNRRVDGPSGREAGECSPGANAEGARNPSRSGSRPTCSAAPGQPDMGSSWASRPPHGLSFESVTPGRAPAPIDPQAPVAAAGSYRVHPISPMTSAARRRSRSA